MLNVPFHALAQGCDDVLATHRALVSEKDGMDQFLLKLRGTWHGGAGMNWQTTQNHWNVACDEINQILFQLFSALEEALTNYQTTENALQQMWGGH